MAYEKEMEEYQEQMKENIIGRCVSGSIVLSARDAIMFSRFMMTKEIFTVATCHAIVGLLYL